MFYPIKQTKAFILKREKYGNTDHFFTIYTENFGKIFAFSRSTQKEKSKLRQQLNLYSFNQINLILSKSGWKITGVQEIISPFSFVENIKFELIRYLANILFLLSEEEKNPPLWKTVESTLLFLKNNENSFLSFWKEEIKIIILTSIFFHTGYWKKREFESHISKRNLLIIRKNKEKIVKKIKKSITSSQIEIKIDF